MIKNLKICIHRKSNPAAWPMMINKSEKSASTENLHPALTMDDDKQIWKYSSTEKSNPTSSPWMMTSKSEKSTSTEKPIQRFKLNVHLYNSWERLPCDVSFSCSLLRTWLLSIGWLDLQESVWFGGSGRFGELRTSTFEVLHVLPISRSFASLLLLLQVWSKPVENRSLRTPESFTTKRNPQLHLRASNAD